MRKGIKMNCQLMKTEELVKENGWWEDLAQMRIKILCDTKKKVLLLKNKSMEALGVWRRGKALTHSMLPSIEGRQRQGKE